MLKEKYNDYLVNIKKVSNNTIQAYLRDLKHFEMFLTERDICDSSEASNADIVAYLMQLKSEGKTRATVNRKLASIRMYYDFLVENSYVKINPTHNIRTPRIEKKEIEFISIEEMEKVLSVPGDTIKEKRDSAILELLYATGIRASELIDMKLDDVNIRMGFIKCQGENTKARIIPMGRICRTAMEEYVLDIRAGLLKGNETDALFLNYNGAGMTRQGLWKILKEYGERAGLAVSLTPQVIRNSFAVHMLQNGADIKSLQELMGHEDIAATQAYLAVTKNRIKDVYDRSHPRA